MKILPSKLVIHASGVVNDYRLNLTLATKPAKQDSLRLRQHINYSAKNFQITDALYYVGLKCRNEPAVYATSQRHLSDKRPRQSSSMNLI